MKISKTKRVNRPPLSSSSTTHGSLSLSSELRHRLRRFELDPRLSHGRAAKLSPFGPKTPSFTSSFPRFSTWVSYANGKDSEDGFSQNVSEEEDADEMFDRLFGRYGKVVFSRNGNKSRSAEVDYDSESLSFAVAMAKVASEVKAADIKVLFVKPLVYWTRLFIITTAFSRPQIDAIRSKIRDLAEEQHGKFPTGDTKPNSWTLLDFGDVVVHIFLPEQRAFYNLEEFYANTTAIELPFNNQLPFRR